MFFAVLFLSLIERTISGSFVPHSSFSVCYLGMWAFASKSNLQISPSSCPSWRSSGLRCSVFVCMNAPKRVLIRLESSCARKLPLTLCNQAVVAERLFHEGHCANVNMRWWTLWTLRPIHRSQTWMPVISLMKTSNNRIQLYNQYRFAMHGSITWLKNNEKPERENRRKGLGTQQCDEGELFNVQAGTLPNLRRTTDFPTRFFSDFSLFWGLLFSSLLTPPLRWLAFLRIAAFLGLPKGAGHREGHVTKHEWAQRDESAWELASPTRRKRLQGRQTDLLIQVSHQQESTSFKKSEKAPKATHRSKGPKAGERGPRSANGMVQLTWSNLQVSAFCLSDRILTPLSGAARTAMKVSAMCAIATATRLVTMPYSRMNLKPLSFMTCETVCASGRLLSNDIQFISHHVKSLALRP